MSDESEQVQTGELLVRQTRKSLDACRAEKRRLRARLAEVEDAWEAQSEDVPSLEAYRVRCAVLEDRLAAVEVENGRLREEKREWEWALGELKRLQDERVLVDHGFCGRCGYNRDSIRAGRQEADMKRWIVRCQPDGRYTEVAVLVEAVDERAARSRAVFELNVGRQQDVPWVAMNVLEIAKLEWAE